MKRRDNVTIEMIEKVVKKMVIDEVTKQKNSEKEKEQKETYKKSVRELDKIIRDVKAYHQRRTVRERKAEHKQPSDLKLESMVHLI